MVERDFEAGLERMFSHSAVLPDADAFTGRVEARLNRDWRWRTLGIGAAGVVGGVVAATQTIGSGMGVRFEQISSSSVRTAGSLYQQGVDQAGSLLQAGTGASLFWIVSGLMILAAIVGATRAFDEL